MRVITSLDNWKMFIKFNRKEAIGLTNYCFEIEYKDNESIEPIIEWCIDNTKDLIYFEHFGNTYDLAQFGLTQLPTSENINVYIKDEADAITFKLTWMG